jgi:anaerobic selenocysteine-containing dehydrogenase
VDVLLAAVRAAGGELADGLNYQDEVDFLKKSLAVLIDQGGVDEAPNLEAFWDSWRRHGGWWTRSPGMMPPVSLLPLGEKNQPNLVDAVEEAREAWYTLVFFISPDTSDGGCAEFRPEGSPVQHNRVEIHPKSSREIGVRSGEAVSIATAEVEIEAIVRETENVVPGAIAIPVGCIQSQRAPYNKARGANPLDLVGERQNESGNMAFTGVRVKVIPKRS